MNRRSNLWKFVVIEQFRAMSVNESAECETILETEHRTQHSWTHTTRRQSTSLQQLNHYENAQGRINHRMDKLQPHAHNSAKHTSINFSVYGRRAGECTKMHHFETQNYKHFLWRGTAPSRIFSQKEGTYLYTCCIRPHHILLATAAHLFSAPDPQLKS